MPAQASPGDQTVIAEGIHWKFTYSQYSCNKAALALSEQPFLTGRVSRTASGGSGPSAFFGSPIPPGP